MSDSNRPRMKVLGIPKSLDEYEAMYGIRPAAMPGSGYCMSCGKQMVPPPAGPDIDHAVCHACFPEDLRDGWEGRQEDYVQVNLSEGTLEKIEPPLDPFV